jgi:hypothetical protein
MLGSIEDRQHQLKTLLKVEQKLEMIIQAINRSGEGKEAALMLISHQAIPCIMHLENRVGEKLISVLLAMNANIFRKKTNTTTINTRFANNIQSVVNTRTINIFLLKGIGVKNKSDINDVADVYPPLPPLHSI